MKKGSVLVQFGERVRSLRKSEGLSQEKLGEIAGIHYTYIGGVERGERNVSLKNIEKIAKGLGVDITELFSFPQRLSPRGQLREGIANLLRRQEILVLETVLRVSKTIIEDIG